VANHEHVTSTAGSQLLAHAVDILLFIACRPWKQETVDRTTGLSGETNTNGNTA
jgi:hypothetical protein